MRNSFSGYTLMLAGILSLALGSCERINGIDNNNVIIKPFALMVSDTNGLLLYSNDGSEYHQRESKTNDGMPMRAIATSGSNILFVKQNAFVSENEGNTFNPISVTLQASAAGFNQSMVLNAKGWNRVYMAGDAVLVGGTGIIYSDSNGKIDTWINDKTFEQGISLNFTATSFTQLRNGNVLALAPFEKRLFLKTGKDDAWTEVGMAGFPGNGLLYLSHFGNTIIIADYNGSGIWYSQDMGGNWAAYTGLPTNTTYTTVYAPFEKTVLVGTSGQGIFRFDPTTNTFSPANNGLVANTVVRGITAKDRVYKNDTENQSTSAEFIFLATHQGVFRSQDLGQNWFLVKNGSFTAIY